jgi:uncharacterized protein DUF1064
MGTIVMPNQRVRNRTKAAKRKRRKKLPPEVAAANGATNWANLRRLGGAFKKSKRGKYNARGRWIEDHWFPSKAEGDRYEQLVELARAGTIDSLVLQPAWRCVVNGVLVCTYRADFQYRINPGRLGQRTLIEDVKGMVTKEYRIKKRLVEALHPIEIIELPVPKRGGVERYRFLTADQFGPLPAARQRMIAAAEEGM